MKHHLLLTAFRIALYGLFSLPCIAQDTGIKFNLVEGNNNESLGRINAITQDANGYMWFSGQGKTCLYKYDGVRMIAYPLENMNPRSQVGNFPETVYADSSKKIWVGLLIEGLDLFDPVTSTFKHYRHDPAKPNSLSGGMVSSILRDHLGRLWIGTAEGLDRMDEKTGTFIHYRHESNNPSSLSSSVIRTIYEDHKGVLWIGTGFEFKNGMPQFISEGNGGLNRMEANGSFTRFVHNPDDPTSLVSNKVKSIFEDSRGIFWVGTSGDGLHTMDRVTGKFTRHTYDPDKPEQLARPPLKQGYLGDPITFITEDALGAIWIGTYESGINRYDTVTKKITHFESSNGYPDKNCWAAFESRDGVLWLSSTDPVGFLYRMVLDKNKIKHIPTLKFIHCITEDKQGYLWGAGFQTGLLQFDKNRNLLHVFKEETADSIDLIKNGATSILQENDTLWLCNSKGVILMDKKSQHFKWLRYKRPGDLVENKFTGINTFQIINDKNLYKWIWTNRGLYQYNSQNHTFIVHHLLVDEFEEPTNPLLQDGLGNIWAASLDGIEIFNSVSGHIKSLMKGIKVNCLYRDEEGFIWAGSLDRGLFRYNKGTDSMEVFSDFQSVPGGEKIVNIAVDDWKNLWVITNSAIVKYVADRSRFFVYSKSYGIRSNELWVGGICKTRAGEILVGNARGFYVISPGEMNEVSSPLQLNITGFYVNNKPAFSTNDRILTGPVEQTTSLHLPYNKNDFSFSFAAIDYRAPETNRYYTRLENFDSVWRDAGGDKTANYINIPPGRYIFKVKAINIDNITSEKDVDITISPPWYKTWWAYLIYVLLIITLVVVIHRYQQQRTIRREREKAQVKELAQAREIERAYTELKSTQAQLIQSEKMASLGEMTAGIAHEIQNPLNFVNNFSELNKELAEDLIAELGSDNYRSGDVQSPSEIAEDIKKNEVKINYHGRRADAIVKSMLQHSQGSFGTKEPTDINELADKYLRLAYHSIGTKDSIPVPVGIKTDFDDSVKKINIVPQEIGKVLLNLYNNALYEVRECAVIRLRRMEAASYELQTVNGDPPNGEASFYEPEVCVTTRRNGSYVVITVKDNGNGIPGNIIDKIFQPFFTTKPTGQGTGLGLSLAYDIVKAHGGSLRVESKMGEGSSFVVQLPG